MDDIIFKKVWEDEVMFEVNVLVKTERMNVNQNFYMTEEILNKLCESLSEYSLHHNEEKEIIISHNVSDDYPIVKMKLLPADEIGNVSIDIYFAYDEHVGYIYYCNSIVETNLSHLSILSEKLKYLLYEDLGYKVYLNSFNS